MTLEECATDCAGFTYFGVEYGGECLLTSLVNQNRSLANIL